MLKLVVVSRGARGRVMLIIIILIRIIRIIRMGRNRDIMCRNSRQALNSLYFNLNIMRKCRSCRRKRYCILYIFILG